MVEEVSAVTIFFDNEIVSPNGFLYKIEAVCHVSILNGFGNSKSTNDNTPGNAASPILKRSFIDFLCSIHQIKMAGAKTKNSDGRKAIAMPAKNQGIHGSLLQEQ